MQKVATRVETISPTHGRSLSKAAVADGPAFLSAVEWFRILRLSGPTNSQFYLLPPGHSTLAFGCIWGGMSPTSNKRWIQGTCGSIAMHPQHQLSVILHCGR